MGNRKTAKERKDVREMDQEQRIQAFDETNRPFYIVAHDSGRFSLCLSVTSFDGDDGYGQEAFNLYAAEKGDPVREYGLYTHGSGYEWEAAFRQAFADDPNLGKILFDCEAGGFVCVCDDLTLLEDFGRRFKEICEDTERFLPMIAEGIKNAEARRAEKMRGRMRQPESYSEEFHIIKDNGNIPSADEGDEDFGEGMKMQL